MKVRVWRNNARRLYEATVVGRGRPIYAHAKEEDRATVKRTIATGTTKDEALATLGKLLKVKPDTFEIVKAGVVYTERVKS